MIVASCMEDVEPGSMIGQLSSEFIVRVTMSGDDSV